MGFLFVVVHLVIAPISLPVRAGCPMGPKRCYSQLLVHTPLDSTVEEQDVVVVNPPIPAGLTFYLQVARDLSGQPVPRRARVLAPGWFPMALRRVDARTLVVRPKYGYLTSLFDRLLRDDSAPMALGERVELTGMTVEVTELTADGRPAEASFRFAVPLEDASLRWLQWRDGVFVPFTPPAIGGRVGLPGVDVWRFVTNPETPSSDDSK